MSRDTELTTDHDGHVVIITMNRPPHNFANEALMRRLADTLRALDSDANCRAVVMAAEGKTYCAGADFSASREGAIDSDPSPFYQQVMRLYGFSKPIVAAVQGAAVGAGLGLAVMADFRVSCNEARFTANFTRLGFHPGFGLSITLPRLVGEQKAALMFYTGRRLTGTQALAIGLVDELVPQAEVRDRAIALAQEIAGAAPIALQSTRATLRGDLALRIEAVNRRELARQQIEFATQDFKEGVAAMAARRAPVFQGM